HPPAADSHPHEPMTHRYLLPAAVLLALAPAARAVDPADLKPGLVATYSDGKQTVTRLEPTVALALNSGESPHPQLSAARAISWKGYIDLVRPGWYQFSARMQGGVFTLRLDGKIVFAANGVEPSEW